MSKTLDADPFVHTLHCTLCPTTELLEIILRGHVLQIGHRNLEVGVRVPDALTFYLNGVSVVVMDKDVLFFPFVKKRLRRDKGKVVEVPFDIDAAALGMEKECTILQQITLRNVNGVMESKKTGLCQKEAKDEAGEGEEVKKSRSDVLISEQKENSDICQFHNVIRWEESHYFFRR